MKLFDMHADIGYDVIQHKKRGIEDVVQTIHLPKFKKGEIQYVGMASYFEGGESWEDMQAMVSALREQILACDELDLVETREALLSDNGRRKALMTIEGMCGIKDDAIEKLHWLYDQGVRIASLCWNEENALATGVRGTKERGLTDMGKALVEEMIKLSMIIDVSHANEKTFDDIMALSPTLIVATHSNLRDLCDHPRNLWKRQALALKACGGVIGMNSAPMFVDQEEEKQDVAHLVHHVCALKDLVGIEHIAIGFDFMDFYEDYAYNMKEMPSCVDAQKFVKELETQGFQEAEIRKICYENALRVIQEAYQ